MSFPENLSLLLHSLLKEHLQLLSLSHYQSLKDRHLPSRLLLELLDPQKGIWFGGATSSSGPKIKAYIKQIPEWTGLLALQNPRTSLSPQQREEAPEFS